MKILLLALVSLSGHAVVRSASDCCTLEAFEVGNAVWNLTVRVSMATKGDLKKRAQQYAQSTALKAVEAKTGKTLSLLEFNRLIRQTSVSQETQGKTAQERSTAVVRFEIDATSFLAQAQPDTVQAFSVYAEHVFCLFASLEEAVALERAMDAVPAFVKKHVFRIESTQSVWQVCLAEDTNSASLAEAFLAQGVLLTRTNEGLTLAINRQNAHG